ncbi:MAG TPA: amidase [Candidatus Acidoferrales bacterium]|nr:amidase [Candidatus Acidoferrales bacterium]
MSIYVEETLYLTIKELGDRLRTGAMSPVDLTKSYLERAKRLGPRWNAYALLTPELALEQARVAQQEIAAGRYRGPLHGIPYAAKDLLAVRGLPTTWGARPYAAQQFNYDATVVARLREAGAVMLGKAAMIELAGGMGYRYASASLTGAAKNPWNEECWTCGSSSGSGAIVAGALAAFAIGTETWGSIICPSAFCGISGLRPTYGRVSRHGGMVLCSSLDKIGPMARSAVDCGMVMAAIAGHDPKDASSLPREQAEFVYRGIAGGERKPRIGWIAEQMKDAQPGVIAAANAARKALEAAGAAVRDAKLPEGPWEAAAGVIVSAEGASAFDDLITTGLCLELTDPLGKIGGFVSQQISSTDYLRAERIRAELQEKMAEMMREYDVLAAASENTTAPKLSTNLETDLSGADPMGAIGNLCGLPAMSVPCGFDGNGLPVGLQFLGPALGDHAVVEAAEFYQRHTNWHRKHPPGERSSG